VVSLRGWWKFDTIMVVVWWKVEASSGNELMKRKYNRDVQ
jgi:hypothetical protein